MTYAAIVYDLDGTLIDSAVVVTALLNELRAERGLPALTMGDYKPWLSIGGRAMISAALNIPESDADAPVAAFRSRYHQRPTDPATVFPDVRNTLTTLRSMGLKLGLCTNKPRALTDKVLRETELHDFFTSVCAGNDLPTAKPHPDNLRVCLEALNAGAHDTLVIGDSSVDQQLAHASGADFAFFSGGYDDGVKLNASTPVIHRHVEILDLILKPNQRAHHE